MVSLVKGLAASVYAVVHSVPYQYQTISNKLKTSKVLNAANNDVSLFFGWDYTTNKQEKTAWQLVNRKADFFLLNESIRIDSHNESNQINSNRELECSSCDFTISGNRWDLHIVIGIRYVEFKKRRFS